MAATLGATVASETRSVRELLNYRGEVPEFKADGRWICPLCPFMTFRRKEYVIPHVDKCHRNAEGGTKPTKQRKMTKALWDFDLLKERSPLVMRPLPLGMPMERTYLQRSAAILQDQLRSSPSWANMGETVANCPATFDRHISVLLDCEDARYILSVDKPHYHKISKDFVCTDKFLSMFLAALLHPDTKCAKSRVISFIAEKCGWKANFIPTDRWIYATLCETLVDHPVIRSKLQMARSAVDKTVLGIDGQYSALLSVLYQEKHGAQSRPTADDSQEVHVLLTVQCLESVLLVKAAPSEAPRHQVEALDEAVGTHGATQLRLLFSDDPAKIDVDELYGRFVNLEGIAKDALHIPLRVEKASGEKKTALSN